MLKSNADVVFLEDVEYSKYVNCVIDNYEEKQYISYYCHDIEKGSKNPGREIRTVSILLQEVPDNSCGDTSI